MAAFDGRDYVTEEDVKSVVKMVFLHRLKSMPFEKTKYFDMDKINQIIGGEN